VSVCVRVLLICTSTSLRVLEGNLEQGLANLALFLTPEIIYAVGAWTPAVRFQMAPSQLSASRYIKYMRLGR
jgi:hypothetical protein